MSVPVETLVVTFFEHPVMAVREREGQIFLALRDLCDAVGLNLSSQLRRLRRDQDLSEGLRRFKLPTAGGIQEQETLLLEFVPTWIGSVNRSKAGPAVQERLRYLRLFAIKTVYDALSQAAGLPGGSSARIEDLQDLERLDGAMTEMARRQREIEDSLQKARMAWREQQQQLWQQEELLRSYDDALRLHEERLKAIESELRGGATLTPAQRGQIYQLVQQWAQARIAHEGATAQLAFAGCWAAIKTRYRVAKYEHIPSASFDDCVGFIQHKFRDLTGEELLLPSLEDGGNER